MTTFVSMTYNLWGRHHLDARVPALSSLFEVRPPDLLSVQELTPRIRELIDAALPGHRRVEDAFPGWATQSNLWWRDDLFTLEEYGAEDVGIRAEHARLFWVRLGAELSGRSDTPPGREGLQSTGGHRQTPPLERAAGTSFVYATAHLTWPGHPQERADDVSPRVEQARNIVAALDRLAGDGPCLFTADVNDYARPLWVLREAGFADAFAALGRSSPITHPVVPLVGPGRGWAAPEPVAKAIDWQFHRGPLRPRCAEVVEFFHEGVAPSDHKPVVVTYTLPDKE